jgi:hypothetical protein
MFAPRCRRYGASLLAVLLAGVFAAVAPSDPGAAAYPRAGQCYKLRLTRSVKRQLFGAYRRATHLRAAIRLVVVGRSYYGRCGDLYYAYIQLRPTAGQHLTDREKVSQQDQSYVNKRSNRGAWKELGFGPICGPGYIPRALARVWHFGCP